VRRRWKATFRRKALETWREKLDFLQSKRAITAAAENQFELDQLIEEAQARIAELEREANA
jgi:hypothetical protein